MTFLFTNLYSTVLYLEAYNLLALTYNLNESIIIDTPTAGRGTRNSY